MEARVLITPRLLRELADQMEAERELQLLGRLVQGNEPVTVALGYEPALDRPCIRCKQQMPGGYLERNPNAKQCARCTSDYQREVHRRGPVDDLRWQRSWLPTALRQSENLIDND